MRIVSTESIASRWQNREVASLALLAWAWSKQRTCILGLSCMAVCVAGVASLDLVGVGFAPTFDEAFVAALVCTCPLL